MRTVGGEMAGARAFLERIRVKDPAERAVLEGQVAALPARGPASCRVCDDARYLRGAPQLRAGSGAMHEARPAHFTTLVRCPACGDRRDPEQLLARSGIPSRMRAWSFETFPAAPGKAEARRAVEAWAEACARGEPGSLRLLGANGRGKSGLAAAAVGALCRRGVEARFMPVGGTAGLLAAIRARFGPGGAVERYLEGLVDGRVLVLDDLTASSVPPWAEEHLTALVDGRLQGERPTLITTDVDLRAIAEHLGARLASRLREYELVEVGGEDLRGSRS